jgi:hypothetical protein
MPELSIRVKIPKDARELVLNSFDGILGDAARRSVELLYDITVNELEARGHKAEGDLESVLYTTTDISSFSTGVVAALHTDDVAASVLEYGADPTGDGGLVNIDSIERWLEAKHITPSYGTTRDYAWAIARKIGREGQSVSKRYTSPGRPFNNAQRKAKRQVEKIWDEAVEKFVMGVSNA